MGETLEYGVWATAHHAQAPRCPVPSLWLNHPQPALRFGPGAFHWGTAARPIRSSAETGLTPGVEQQGQEECKVVRVLAMSTLPKTTLLEVRCPRER
jgi:hypothetical protein